MIDLKAFTEKIIFAHLIKFMKKTALCQNTF